MDVGFNRYDREPGSAYWDAPRSSGGTAPLYCVSPNNALPVTGWRPDLKPTDPPPVQSNPSGACPTSLQPEKSAGFWRRLSLHASIGQAF